MDYGNKRGLNVYAAPFVPHSDQQVLPPVLRRECHPLRLHPPPVIIPINGDHLQASDVSAAMKASVIDTGDPVTLQVPPIVNLAPLMQSLTDDKPSGKIHIDKPMLRTTSQPITSFVCIDACSPIEHKSPHPVLNNNVDSFVKPKRANPTFIDPVFDQRRLDPTDLLRKYNHVRRPRYKRPITGFSCNDMKRVIFKAHDDCIPDYFQSAKICQDLLATRLSLDPSSSIKSLKGSLQSKRLNIAYRKMMCRMDCVKSLIEFRDYLDELINREFNPSSSQFRREDATIHPCPKLYKGKYHLAPEVALQALHSIRLRPSLAVLDSGCMKHFVTSSMSAHLLRQRKHKVDMLDAAGNITHLDDEGDLEVHLFSPKGVPLRSLPLSNCSVSPHSPFNLLSVSQLNNDGVGVRMSNGGDYLEFDGFRFRCIRLHGLYLIDLLKPLHAYENVPLTVPAQVSLVEPTLPDDTHVSKKGSSVSFVEPFESNDTPIVLGGLSATIGRWHERLGHASKETIKSLAKSGHSEGLHVNKDPPHNAKCKCKVCLATNNVRNHIPEVRQFATEVSQKGQILTSDVIGPLPTSPEGHRYAVSYVDDLSRYSLVYFLKAKSEVAGTVHAVVRYYRSLGILIQKIRTDQGGEFGGHHERDNPSGGLGKLTPGSKEDHQGTAYAEACKKYHIVHEPFPAYTPQLNGVAERWNRTVMTMANAMMYNARVHPTLWTYAVAHANHLRNRLPTSARGGYTPYELFFNRRPRYDNLRIWGSYCYKLLPVRTKIPGLPVRKQLIYIGEASDSIGFRCFDPITHELSTEHELLFDEEEVSKRHALLHNYDHRRDLAVSGGYDHIPLIYRADHTVPDPSRKVYSTEPDHSHSMDAALGSQPMRNASNMRNSDVTVLSVPATVVSNSGSNGTLPITPTSPYAAVGDNSVLTPKVSHGHSAKKSRNRVSFPTTSKLCTLITKTIDDSSPLCVVSSAPSQPGPDTRGSPLLADTTLNDGTKGVRTSARLKKSPPKNPTVTSMLDPMAVPLVPNQVDQHTSMAEPMSANNVPVTTPGNLNDSGFNLDPTSCSLFPDITPLDDLNEFGIITHPQAASRGPLVTHSIVTENRKYVYNFDVNAPICSHRHSPVGAVTILTDEDKRWLNFALKHHLLIHIQRLNPKLPGSDSYERYNRSKNAQTLAEYYRLLQLSGIAHSKITQDIAHDYARGYISFPKYLYRDPHDPPLETAMFIGYSGVNIPEPPVQSVPSSPLLALSSKVNTDNLLTVKYTFHDLIQSLWPRDDSYLSDAELETERTQALALTSSIITDGPVDPTYRQALQHDNPEREAWSTAIKKELDTLSSRGTWTLVPRKQMHSNRKKPVRHKFVLKKKLIKNGTVQYKARLVACGYSQVAGQDFSSDEL